jgi:hypothetical protein
VRDARTTGHVKLNGSGERTTKTMFAVLFAFLTRNAGAPL